MATYRVQQDLNTNLLMLLLSNRNYYEQVDDIHKYIFRLPCFDEHESILHIPYPHEQSTTHDQCNFSCHAIQLCDEKRSLYNGSNL